MNETTTLADIERAAKDFAGARGELVDEMAVLQSELAAIKNRHLAAIRRLVARAADKQSALHNLVAGAPELFTQPRTVVFHGVQCGFHKQKGTLEFDDADRVIALIRKHYPDQVDALVRVKATPDKGALLKLPAGDLKRLGVAITEAGDKVVVKPVDSEVDAMVTALLDEAAAAAAAA